METNLNKKTIWTSRIAYIAYIHESLDLDIETNKNPKKQKIEFS